MEGFPLQYIIFPVIAGVLIYSIFFNKKARIKRKLKKSFSKDLEKFKNGDIAKIVGTIEFIDEPIIAPFSNRPCAYCHIIVEENSSSKNSNTSTIIDEVLSCKFLIKNGEHFAYINDANIKSYIVQDIDYGSGFLNDAPKYLENYLNKHGEESEGAFGFNRSLNYKEGILEEHEVVAVYGKGQWKDAADLELPEKYGKVLVLTSHDDEAIYLSDDPETTNKKEKKESSHVKTYSYNKDYK